MARRYGVLLLLLAGILITRTVPSAAEEVWSGYDFFFEKQDYADWTLEENQDRITGNVWLTRQDIQGLFNIFLEDHYTNFVSPMDTEWAFGHAEDWQSLTFDCWECITDSTPPDLVGQDVVVHLITDDIYIDIRFEQWTAGAQGGGFSYIRGTSGQVPVGETSWGRVKSLYR